MLNALSSFKEINTIIIKAWQLSEDYFNRCIETTKQRLIALAPSKERRYIRVWHEGNNSEFQYSDINAFVQEGYYSEIPI